MIATEIYFDDLKPEAQQEFLDKLGTTPGDEVFPVAVFVREKGEF